MALPILFCRSQVHITGGSDCYTVCTYINSVQTTNIMILSYVFKFKTVISSHYLKFKINFSYYIQCVYIHIVCNMNYLNISLGMVGTHGLTFKGLEVEVLAGLNPTMRSAWKVNALSSCSGAEPGILVWGGQVVMLIYQLRQTSTHTCI